MLNDTQRTTLIALIDRIVPADEFPSASQAGADAFIVRLLQTDLKSWAMTFAGCLEAVDVESRSMFGDVFSKLDAGQQDRLLDEFENAPASKSWSSGWAESPASFLRRLVHLTSEGYYSDPTNGGNRNEISWKMVGYEPGANRP